MIKTLIDEDVNFYLEQNRLALNSSVENNVKINKFLMDILLETSLLKTEDKMGVLNKINDYLKIRSEETIKFITKL